MIKHIIKPYEIYYADLRPVTGSEQGGVRLVAIIQNCITNNNNTVICAPITIKTTIEDETSVITSEDDHVILLQHIRGIDKSRIKDKFGQLSDKDVYKIKEKLRFIFNIE